MRCQFGNSKMRCNLIWKNNDNKRQYALLKIKLFFVAGLVCTGAMAHADVIQDAQEALQVAGEICSGISEEIEEVSGSAKINTAVTSVGTVAGGAGVAVGLSKSKVDKEIAELEKQICDAGGCDAASVEKMSGADFFHKVMMPMAEVARRKELQEKSKKLGNWRTGLLAGASVTHVASVVMSRINTSQSDLVQHVTACNSAIEYLTDVYQKMSNAGINPYEYPIRNTVRDAIDACQVVNIEDIEKIEKRERWVFGSSAMGGAAAIAGTATSASANSAKVRQATGDKAEKKERNLNVATNVLAGVSTVGSGVATGFNISLLTLTNKLIKSAQLCEETLLK